MLQHLGYTIVRQKGSHVRLCHSGPPEHLITVPLHNPLKTGTLHGILAEVAQVRAVEVETLAELL
jgi:predicted RNA binding protein YcfA (HicA-like mRNA interferase family)